MNTTPQEKWNRKHPETIKKASARWRKKHPQKVKAANRSRDRRQQRYGLSQSEFDAMLKKQHNRCLGCQKEFSGRICVDHNHETKIVRGLLCSECNIALGLVKEDIGTLRQLIAYLDYDRTKTNIYIIGALKNSRIPEIGNRLRSEGYDVMDEWFTPGAEADINWQKYEKLRGRTYKEALRGRAATNIFLFDKAYINLADIVIMVMPAGKSAMIELGYAKGRGKKAYILLDGMEPEKYDVMPNFADQIFTTEDELIAELRRING